MGEHESILPSKEVIFKERIKKLRWVVKIRYIAPIAIWFAIVITTIPDVFESTYFYIYSAVTLLFLLVNIFIDMYLRRLDSLPLKNIVQINLSASIVIQTLFDTILFTILIYFDGSIESPAVLLYMFVIVVAGFLTEKLYAWISVGVMSVLYALLLIGEYTGVIQHVQSRGPDAYLDAQIVFSDLGFVIVMFGLILFLIHFMSRESHTVEAQLEKTLKEYDEIKEQYKDLTENAFDLIQSVDSKGNLLLTNKRWREVLGYSEKEAMKMNVFDVFEEKSVLQYKNSLDDLQKKNQSQRVRLKMVTKNGEPVDVELALSAKFDSNGQLVSTREILRDITERVRVEKEAQEKASQLEALNETMVGRELKIAELQQELREKKTD